MTDIDMTDDQPDEGSSLLALTAGIVAAHLEHNVVPATELPELIRSVHEA